MKFFNLDSPVMQALGKMADLMWLNILTLICCIPVVTVGASLTAMHYMALKIVRNEECEVLRVGADFRIKCRGCGHQVMIARRLLEKNIKEIL